MLNEHKNIARIVWINERLPQSFSRKLEKKFQESMPWRYGKPWWDSLNGYHKHIMSKGGFKLP